MRARLNLCAFLDALSVGAAVLFLCIAKIDGRAAVVVLFAGVLARFASHALAQGLPDLDDPREVAAYLDNQTKKHPEQ